MMARLRRHATFVIDLLLVVVLAVPVALAMAVVVLLGGAMAAWDAWRRKEAPAPAPPTNDAERTATRAIARQYWKVMPQQVKVEEAAWRDAMRTAATAHEAMVRPLGVPMERVFVYGTLRRGESRHGVLGESARLVRDRAVLSNVAMYTVEGRGFPMLYLGTGTAVGEVYDVEPSTLAMLDEIEAHPILYKRRRMMVEGTECWVYIGTARTTHPQMIPVPDGDWCAFREEERRRRNAFPLY